MRFETQNPGISVTFLSPLFALTANPASRAGAQSVGSKSHRCQAPVREALLDSRGVLRAAVASARLGGTSAS